MDQLTKRTLAVGLVVGAVSLSGCERSKSETGAETSPQAEGTAAQQPAKVTRAAAKLSPTEGHEASGTVHFEQAADGVKVTAELTGLAPNSVHGFHIHEKGDCSAPDASSAGGHYAPDDNPHGLPPDEQRHAGDMGNITADAQGKATFEGTFGNFSLSGDAPVLGRAVIVHVEQDQGTQPTGDAGSRAACGVIEAEE